MFGTTTNVSLKNNEEVSDVNIKLDWANKDEEKIIENFLLSFKYSLSGKVIPNVQNEIIDASKASIIIQANGALQGLTKCNMYGNYNYGDPDYSHGLNYGDYSLTAFKYVPPEGKYLFGTTNISFKNIQEVSDVNIQLDWANKDQEKIIENFLLHYNFRYLSGSIFSNIQDKNINLSSTNIIAQRNGDGRIIKCDEYGNYRFGDLSDIWLEHGNYSLTGFKYIPSEEKFLYGTTNVSLEKDIEVYDANISLDWASEDEEEVIEGLLPLLRYSMSGSVFSNILGEDTNISKTNIIIQSNNTWGLTKGLIQSDEYGNYNSEELDYPEELRSGNYSVISFKYIPSEEKFLYGRTEVFLKNKEQVSDIDISLDWATNDEEKIIEDFFPLLRYSLSGSVLFNSQNGNIIVSEPDSVESDGSRHLNHKKSTGPLPSKYNNSIKNEIFNKSNLEPEAGVLNVKEGNLSMREERKTEIERKTQNETAIANSREETKIIPGLTSINLILTLFLVLCFSKGRLLK